MYCSYTSDKTHRSSEGDRTVGIAEGDTYGETLCRIGGCAVCPVTHIDKFDLELVENATTV